MITYSIPAFRSLYLELFLKDKLLSTATGFVVKFNEKSYLITNRHVMTGTNSFTKENFGMPNSIRIFHHKVGEVGLRVEKTQPLYSEDEQPLWHEHPTLNEAADIVALRITELEDIALHPYDVFRPTFQEYSEEVFSELALEPTDSVSIVGFPFGKSSQGGFPIWVNGFLASEMNETYRNLPVVLVDSRTRPGQSGSPVVLYRPAGAPIRGIGSLSIGRGAFGALIGVYSGRIDQASDIGMIWKLSALAELLESITDVRL